MLNYYKIKGYADSKLRAKVELLKNNQKVGLFTVDEWKVGLLISIFPLSFAFTDDHSTWR